MTQTLTDLTALASRRARARAAPAIFLHEAAIDELQFRLAVVNRTFQSATIITGWPEIWQRAFPEARCIPDEETLDLEPQSQDLIIHAMALHWANDPVGQLIQCRRALRPDGLFLAAALGGETLSELRSTLAEAEIAITGGLSPRVAPMAAIRDLGSLLQRAGFALPVVDGALLTAAYRSVWHLMSDLRAMGETNALHGRLRHPTRRAVFERAETLYRSHFPHEDGRIRASFELMIMTGWAPDASQPQPLRPGSATTRLAEALKTQEFDLKS